MVMQRINASGREEKSAVVKHTISHKAVRNKSDTNMSSNSDGKQSSGKQYKVNRSVAAEQAQYENSTDVKSSRSKISKRIESTKHTTRR